MLRHGGTRSGLEKAHVFDIPELLLPICAYLSSHDLLQCILLSRQFNALCIPILYSSIAIMEPFQFSRFLSPDSQAALARHSIHIRSFRTQYYSLLRCLIPDTVNCRNLTRLEFPRACRFIDPIVPRDFYASPSVPSSPLSLGNRGPQDYKEVAGNVSTPFAMARTMNALGLFDETLLIAVMEKCPRLSVFVMAGFPFDHDQLIQRIGDRLATPGTRLKRIELRNLIYCRVRAKSIEYLLSRCTPHMEELLLSISFGSKAEVETEERGTDGVNPSATSCSNTGFEDDDRPLNLRRLEIRGDISGPGPLIWLPLLRRCSKLQDLTVDVFTNESLVELASTLAQHCPQINEMTLQCMAGYPQEDSRIADLVRSSLSWKRLSMSFFHGFGPQSTAALIRHSGTLETLVLTECDGFMSEDIQTVLSSCPNLRTFWAMTSSGMDFSSTVYLDANDMVDSPWVCHNLENLKLVITGIARPDLQVNQYGGLLTGPLHDGTILGLELQRIVYQQLGKLTKIQELWLGHDKQDLDDEENYHVTDVEGQWQYIDPDEQFECLEFSLKSGLDLLGGLKELRVLNVDRMKTRIGLSEVQWMASQWPKLEEIIGLVVQGEKVPKHVQWLYDHRPDIALPPVLGSFFTAF